MTFRNQVAVEHLLKFACYCSHAKEPESILMSYKQAKVTLPIGNHRALPQGDNKQANSKKITTAFGSDDLRVVVLGLSNLADPYFLAQGFPAFL